MRVLHIDKFPLSPGGVASYVAALSDLLTGRGHEVARFGCSTPRAPRPDWPEYFDFTATRSPVALARMIHNADAAKKLDRFLAARPFDVAHLHNIYHHLTPSVLPVLRRRGIATVMTLHDYRLACPTRHLARRDGLCTRCVPNRFHRAASRQCAGLGGIGLALESFLQRLGRRYFATISRFLCPTRYMANVMRQIGVPAGKVTVFRNPLPIAVQECGAEEPGTAPRGNSFLFAGRLSPEKAPELMLELARGVPQARVVLAGEGPMAGSLAAKVREGLTDRVDLVGQVDAGRLAGLRRRAAAVVVTSRCMENSPQTMLEALADGCCVVVPDQPPLREWVRDGVTGRTYATGDAAALAQVAREILARPADHRAMGNAGRKLVLGRHAPDVLAERIEDVYREALSARQNP